MRNRCKKCGREVDSGGTDYCIFCREERKKEEEVALRWQRHAAAFR